VDEKNTRNILIKVKAPSLFFPRELSVPPRRHSCRLAVAPHSPSSPPAQNLLDASLGAWVWWLVGFGIAAGPNASGGLIGRGKYGLLESTFADGTGYTYASWMFQWVSTQGARRGGGAPAAE